MPNTMGIAIATLQDSILINEISAAYRIIVCSYVVTYVCDQALYMADAATYKL